MFVKSVLVSSVIFHVNMQILYECNFDDSVASDHCFTTSITVTPSAGTPSSLQAPFSPLSDVTSSRKIDYQLNLRYSFLLYLVKPTKNGEVCALPYKIGNFTWSMYFCNRGYCPTASSRNSTCATG
jgi:hypothetical protein